MAIRWGWEGYPGAVSKGMAAVTSSLKCAHFTPNGSFLVKGQNGPQRHALSQIVVYITKLWFRTGYVRKNIPYKVQKLQRIFRRPSRTPVYQPIGQTRIILRGVAPPWRCVTWRIGSIGLSVVDTLLPWDLIRARIAPSVVLLMLVINVLTYREPLDKRETWAESLPLGLL